MANKTNNPIVLGVIVIILIALFVFMVLPTL